MKRVVAKLLVVVLLMTLSFVPAANSPKSSAKETKPLASYKGNLKFMYKSENTVEIETGKTMTVTFSNVKKSEVKSLHVFSYDPRVASVKTLSGKKVRYQVKMKKAGSTNIYVSLILKKKRAGSTIWGASFKAYGIKKMKAKELKEIYAKGVKNSTRSAIFDKHKTLFTHYYYWDENEEDIGAVESFQTKDDLYFISHYKGENGEFSDGHYYYKDGFAYWSGDKIEKPGFVFDISDSYKVYQIDLIPDDPEKQKEELDTTGATAYTDGSFVFVTQKGKDKAGAYHRTDMVLTADTGIMVGYSLLRKDKNGKEYVAADCDVELDLDMPDMYESLKREFDRVAKKTVKISYIYDPGTPDEEVLTRDIPEGSCFYFTDVPDGYKLYEDLEGTTPVEPLAPGEFQEEAYEDNTFYLIKDTASAK